MTKLQLAILTSAIVLFFVMYFGCNTKSSEIRALEKTRALEVEQTGIESLVREAKTNSSEAELSPVLILENQLADLPEGDTASVELYKQLSSQWYQLAQPAIAGYYAEKVAEIVNTEEAWSIAGTTYAIGIQRSTDQKRKEFSTGRAIRAFESAISINPDNLNHRVNLALCYTENPPADNPMKGILILRELQQSNPQSVLVLNTLARLAIQTGQLERAIERLEEALGYEPDNPSTNCLLASAYERNGQAAEARTYTEKCNSLTGNLKVTN